MKASVFITIDKGEATAVSELLRKENIHTEIIEQEIDMENGEMMRGYALITSIEEEQAAFVLIDSYLNNLAQDNIQN